jgi:hypothetical protein
MRFCPRVAGSIFLEKTLPTVEIAHLKTVDERRASIDSALVDVDVDLRVDNGL